MVTLTPLEIISLIFAILCLVKLVTIIVNKKIWFDNVANPIYENSNKAQYLFLILAVVVFYFLIQELSIAEIFAVMAFTSFLVGFGFLQYSNEMRVFLRNIYSKKLNKTQCFQIFIWLILILWVLYEIFK